MDTADPMVPTISSNDHKSSPSQSTTAPHTKRNEDFFQFPTDINKNHSSLQHKRQFVQNTNRTDEANTLNFGVEKLNETSKPTFCGTTLFQDSSYTERESDYNKITKYLQDRNKVVSSLEISTEQAVKELSSLYSILDELSNIEEKLNQQRLSVHYSVRSKKSGEDVKYSPLHELNEDSTKQKVLTCDEIGPSDKFESNSLTLRLKNKQPCERSNSAIHDEISFKTREVQNQSQAIYCQGKSKVSKWTKVKAAFKWERANVSALLERNRNDGCLEHGSGLVPNNFEVARYLRVPAKTCVGTSSTDSILSSSSGHVLSEHPTSSTLSSASSVDDVKSVSNHIQIISKEEQLMSVEHSQVLQNKACCTKLRKSKLINDFEILPENVEVQIESKKRRTKLPSPLNLDQKQELNDVAEYYKMQQFKSPKGVRSVNVHNNHKSLNSPANSSVPSSPSRLSDFFAELESEEVSSGDFSDPTTPNHIHPRKILQQKQEEIHKKYEMLRKKLDMEFEAKQRKWDKSKANANICRVSGYAIAKSPTVEIMQSHNTSNVSTELLEESLSPGFKKKLQKWRVKKQERMGPSNSYDIQPSSPIKDDSINTKTKIDWNLWKSGQIKLEGQGLSPLPYEKDLPEDFQKKLEQWNKIKKSSSMICSSEGWKRAPKQTDCFKKTHQEEEKKSEKLRAVEKEKLEKYIC